MVQIYLVRCNLIITEMNESIPTSKKKQQKNKDDKSGQWEALSPRGLTILSLLACIVLPLIIYSNTLRAPFIFDDLSNIVENQDIRHIQDISSKLVYPLKDGSYIKRNDPSRPLIYLSFALNYHFGKLSTWGYHVFNVVIHILSTITIFFLTRKISGLFSGNNDVLLPGTVAIFFASHPINTEAVTYISHRTDSMVTIFYLLAVLFFMMATHGHKAYYFLSLASCLLSLLSKEIAVTLPVTLLLVDLLFVSNLTAKNILQRRFWHLSFWFMMILYVFLRFKYVGIGTGRTDTLEEWSNFTYFITQSYVILKYLKLLVAPAGQCLDHFILPAKTIFEPRILLSFALWILFGTSAYIYIRKYPISQFPGSKMFLFSIAWFFITLSPTSSFLPINDAMTERRLYLSSWGFFLILSLLYIKITNNCIKPYLALVGTHIFLLSLLSFNRNQTYNDPILLWTEAISEYPENQRAYHNLGLSYELKNDFENAARLYEKAIALNPKSATYSNLARLHVQQAKYSKALVYYQKAIALDPNDADLYHDIGTILSIQEKYSAAIIYYQRAIELNKNLAESYFNLGNIFFFQQKYEKALKLYNQCLEINPNYAKARDRLIMIHNELKASESKGTGLRQ